MVIVRGLLKNNDLCSAKVTLDVLHCQPKTLLLIAPAKGKYVVGLKENQKELLNRVSHAIEHQAVLYKTGGVEKGYVRRESRKA